MSKEMLLGAHCSVGGGLQNCFDEADALGINVIQIFSRNQRQWRAKPVSNEERVVFQERWKKSNVKIVFSHSSYLINIGSSNNSLWKNSMNALIAELERCERLGLPFTVLHPGAATGAEEHVAINNIAEALKNTIHETDGYKVRILLENTAGQGTTLGYKFEQLRDIMDLVNSDRIGVCFDTCHAFAAGYDIRTEEGFANTMNELERVTGTGILRCIHLNDSKGILGSHLDRHEHIGKGNIGTTAFRAVMRQYKYLPKVIETPKENGKDKENLSLLRSFT